MIQALRGTKDLLSGEIEYYQFLEQLAYEVFSSFDFEEIRTPMFEMTELFVRSIGEETDIVSKEMYTFKDRKGRSLTLRPEATAPVVRALIEHKMLPEGAAVQKLWYSGPMFRYERPQHGRQRQFHQIGVEIFGVEDASADAEVISLFTFFLRRAGFSELKTRINTVGCPECRNLYNAQLRAFLKGRLKDLCPDCKRRTKTNPLRVFDCKQPGCQKVLADAPRIRPFVCQKCADHFSQLCSALDALDIDYVVDDSLVRGFDYYTRTVFETVLPGLGAQDAVLGGGRYDVLVEELGGTPTPATGASFGVERLVLAMKKNNIPIPAEYTRSVDFYVFALMDAGKEPCMKIVDMLRKEGKRVRFEYSERSMKSGLRAANRAAAKFALIIGEQELKDRNVLVKEMETGEQRNIPLTDFQTWVERLK